MFISVHCCSDVNPEFHTTDHHNCFHNIGCLILLNVICWYISNGPEFVSFLEKKNSVHGEQSKHLAGQGSGQG